MNPSFTNIDMQIVKATVTKPTLQKITNDLTIDDFNPLKEDCWRQYRITVNGIYIIRTRRKDYDVHCSTHTKWCKKIIADGEKQEVGGVKPRECRN